MFFNIGIPSVKPMAVSKGVDPGKVKVQNPRPMFGIEPFENYAAVPHSNKRVMGWNVNNDFTATSMVNASSHFAVGQMNKNVAIGRAVEKNKRRF